MFDKKWEQFKFKIEIAYVDPWDMVNNYCFDVYAQKWVFVIMSHV